MAPAESVLTAAALTLTTKSVGVKGAGRVVKSSQRDMSTKKVFLFSTFLSFAEVDNSCQNRIERKQARLWTHRTTASIQ